MGRPPNNSVADNENLLKVWDYEKNSITPDKASVTIQTKYWWNCSDCGKSYEESPRSKLQLQRGCLVCANFYLIEGVNDYSKQYPEYSDEYSAFNFHSYSSIYINKSTPLLWWCNKGHLYETSLGRKIGDRDCPYCAHKKLLTGFNDVYSRYPHLMPYWDYELNEVSPKNIFAGYGDFYWKCENNHSWKSRLTPSLEKEFYCSYCCGRTPMRRETDLATTMPESLKMWDYEKNYPKTPENFKKYSHAKVWWRCEDKKHSYEKSIAKWSDSPNCPKCYGNYSKIEKEFGKVLGEIYEGEIITNSKKIIAPYEVDFYLPEVNVAIEFNGDYWHSGEVLLKTRGMASKDYHGLKKSLCEDRGIRLLFVWESDWLTSRSIVVKSLQEVIALDFTIPEIFGRLE